MVLQIRAGRGGRQQDGARAADDGIAQREQRTAWIELAILRIPPFAALYQRFTDVRLPARAVLIDALKELDVPSDRAFDVTRQLHQW